MFLLNARGNYIHAPGKFVAAVGVSDLVVVETPDALLITTRQHAQDVGKIVKYLDEKKLHKLTSSSFVQTNRAAIARRLDNWKTKLTHSENQIRNRRLARHHRRRLYF